MTYVLYKNGNVKKKNLPKSYKNISGFDNAPVSILNANDWYELIEDTTTIEPYQKVSDQSYELVSNQLIETLVIVDKDINQFKQEKKNEIKSDYNWILSEGFDSPTFSIKVGCNHNDITIFNSGKVLMDLDSLTEIDIIDYNDDLHTFLYNDYLTLLSELLNYYIGLLHTKNTYIQSIKDETDIIALSSISWLEQGPGEGVPDEGF